MIALVDCADLQKAEFQPRERRCIGCVWVVSVHSVGLDSRGQLTAQSNDFFGLKVNAS